MLLRRIGRRSIGIDIVEVPVLDDHAPDRRFGDRLANRTAVDEFGALLEIRPSGVGQIAGRAGNRARP